MRTHTISFDWRRLVPMFIIELSPFGCLRLLGNEQTVNSGMPKSDDGGETLYCVDASLDFFGVAKYQCIDQRNGWDSVHCSCVDNRNRRWLTRRCRRNSMWKRICSHGWHRFPSATVKLLLICQKTLSSKPSTTCFRFSGAELLQSKPKCDLFTESILEAM